MNSLYELLTIAQLENVSASASAYETIINRMQPKIKKSLNSVSFEEREDLEQEINIRLFEAISKYNTKLPVPNLMDLLKSKGIEY